MIAPGVEHITSPPRKGREMKRMVQGIAALGAALVLAMPAAGSPAPPQGFQSDSAFAASFAANAVVNVSATTQRVSCYAPEVPYLTALTAADGYPGGGQSPCPGATTGEQTSGFATQDVANATVLVKDKSESDIRVDPLNPMHLIGLSKWFVSAEGYNHLLGFYESWDGGQTWPVQGHVPGYEGWTDNTDPVGAFDPWGNFYVANLPYEFVYDKSGGHVFNNGSKQANPSQPPRAVSVSVHPPGSNTPPASMTTPRRHPPSRPAATTHNPNTPPQHRVS